MENKEKPFDFKKEPSVKNAELKDQKPQERERPLRIMTELDSVINERIQAQPTLEEINDIKMVPTETPGLHRMSLPEYFEKFSYDCTRGETCKVHPRDEKGKYTHRGKFIFRWLFKEKRAIDQALSVKEWYLVNRAHFDDAPDMVFSPNGAVEIGDAILAFMPFEKALRLRKFPAQKSQDLLKARMTVPDKNKPGRVLMTGDPDNQHVYMPDLSKEEGEGDAVTSPGAITVDDF